MNGYDPRVLLAERSRMMDGLKLALDQTRTFNRYCEHLRYLLLATGDSEKVCHDGRTRLTRSYSALSQIDETVGREVQSANLWIKNDQIYQISRVNEYVNKIKEWNDRGESRWLLKTDRDCYQP